MEPTESRELRMTRMFNAPVELVWDVWSTPEHLVNWWGPNGFTTTMHQMDFTEGGEWKLTLHSPDGTDYANRSIFKEIIPLEKIVFEHFNPHFIATIGFEDKGEETQLDWIMLFDTAEIFETVVKVHKADDGLRQNLEKLGEYLSNLPA